MSGAPQYRDGKYCGNLGLYDVRRQTFLERSSMQPMLFEDMPPSSAGMPEYNTLQWWIDEHGGYDEVVDKLDKIPFIVELRWDTDPSATHVPDSDWGWDGPHFGGWWTLYYKDRDDDWLCYINNHGEEGVPDR